MSVLKDATAKGFKLPDKKSGLIYPILRAWLEEENGINVRSYRSSIHKEMFYFSVNVDDSHRYFTSQPLYSTRKDAIESGVDHAVDKFETLLK